MDVPSMLQLSDLGSQGSQQRGHPIDFPRLGSSVGRAPGIYSGSLCSTPSLAIFIAEGLPTQDSSLLPGVFDLRTYVTETYLLLLSAYSSHSPTIQLLERLTHGGHMSHTKQLASI